jgi:hypothetical protein
MQGIAAVDAIHELNRPGVRVVSRTSTLNPHSTLVGTGMRIIPRDKAPIPSSVPVFSAAELDRKFDHEPIGAITSRRDGDRSSHMFGSS